MARQRTETRIDVGAEQGHPGSGSAPSAHDAKRARAAIVWLRAAVRRMPGPGMPGDEIVDMIRSMREERTSAILDAAVGGEAWRADGSDSDKTMPATTFEAAERSFNDDSTPTVGAFEAKTQFSSLLERVRHGEHINITHRGQPVARLIPYASETEADAVDRAFDTIRDLSRKYASRGITLTDINSWTNEGRP